MLDFSVMVLFSSAFSLKCGFFMARKGMTCSLGGPLGEPAWVGNDAEKIPLSWGIFIEAKREQRPLVGDVEPHL